jgi:hypothetical protein
MAQAPVLNTFVGSMNMDTNPSMMKDGDYVYAENCRIGFSESDNVMCVENIKGTLEIPNTDIDSTGRYVTIGAAPWESGSKVYYFVKDTQGTDHGIFEFDLIAKTISPVIRGEVLAFTNKIRSAFYFNDMLVWTDGQGETRQLFVSLARTGFYQTFKSYLTALIKPQPDSAITCELVSDPDGQYMLDGRVYQFIFRYVFYGNQKSAWSMPSKAIATGYDTSLNVIRLTVQSSEIRLAPDYSGIIRYVEIGFRIEDSQPWRFFKRVDFPVINTPTFTVDFNNGTQCPAIATSETNRYYDDVPRTSQALTMASGRVMLGNNKSGFGTIPNIQALNVTRTFDLTPDPNSPYFKSGGAYGIGVTVYDRYQRRSYVYPLDGFVAKERSGPMYATSVSFILSGELPSWAEYWAVCLTKCTNKGSFVQVHINVVSATASRLTFSNTFISPTSPLIGWVFTTGDLISIRTKNGSGDPMATDNFNLPLQYDSSTGNFFVDWDGAADYASFASGAIVELFTPIKSNPDEFYYEQGVLNPVKVINGVKYFGDDAFGNAKIVTLLEGDTQYRTADDCEAMSPTPENFEIWCHNIGRPNIVSQEPEEEVVDTAGISFSNPYVQGTKLNGLNTFEFLSKKTYEVENGAITKLTIARDFQINGSVMLVTTEYNNYSIYLGKVQYTNTDGSTQLAVSDQLLGSYNLLAGGYGSINPESVHAFGTTVRGWDALKGVIWRYSNDGLTPLSIEYGANSYASNKATEIAPNREDNDQTAVAAYDPYFDEYLLCIKDVSSTSNKTIAFNETKNGFSAFYDMDPDWVCTINRSVVSWKSGVLFLHRGSTEYNTLQGRRVTSKISFSVKSDPFRTLNAASMRIYSQDNWSVMIKGIKRAPAKARQVASMSEGSAENNEDTYMYPVKQNTNRTIPDYMKSRYFVAELELDPDVDYLTVLYGSEMVVSESQPTPSRK